MLQKFPADEVCCYRRCFRWGPYNKHNDAGLQMARPEHAKTLILGGRMCGNILKTWWQKGKHTAQ